MILRFWEADILGPTQLSNADDIQGCVHKPWLDKALRGRPSAICCFLQFSQLVGDPSQWSLVLQMLREADEFLQKQSKAVPSAPLILVVVRDRRSLTIPEDRMAMLSQQSQVPRKDILEITPNPSAAEIEVAFKYIESISQSFYARSAGYAVSAFGSSQQLMHQAHCAFKAAVLYELARDPSKSLYYYERAYLTILKHSGTTLGGLVLVMATISFAFVRVSCTLYLYLVSWYGS